ncbi:unnamed protein product [Cyprideis torosa]|uniref:long-chain-fatty-acid--CoA ligase n=1 Tax=Cyprideis torosa TaxID=163714 RepID=A0A7R8W9K6_9CRUS|nr:unnamed protein product [Cyprideis torosa]CAG0889928.1 unnamed protein product [Cyprideis torosa]
MKIILVTKDIDPIIRSDSSAVIPEHYSCTGALPSPRGGFDALVDSSPSEGPDQILPSNVIWTADATEPVKLQITESGPASYKPISIPSLLKKRVEERPYHVAMRIIRNGELEEWSFDQYLDDVRTVAKAFIKLGLKKHYGVCIMGFNSPEWFLSFLGAIFAGGIGCGIYSTNSLEATKHCALVSRANIIVVESQKYLSKILTLRPSLPELRAVVQYIDKPSEPSILSWSQLMKIGRDETDEQLNKRLSEMAVNQVCDIIFTSGTTGPAKAVMLSHDNVIHAARVLCEHARTTLYGESTVSYLPLSHIAAQIVDLFCGLVCGGTATFAKPDALKGTLVETLKEVRPTVFLGVPRVWEKFMEKIQAVGAENNFLKKWIADAAKATALEYHKERIAGKNPGGVTYGMYKLLVFNNVKSALGLDRARFCVSGAAPIPEEVIEYFLSLDIVINQTYGMSESSGPSTCELYDHMRIGSVGPNIEGNFLKICNLDETGEGEICMKGRHIFMGYLGQPNKTTETLDDDGWLHSGDLGRIEDGFLFVTGRIKELIVTAGGENVPPIPIEDRIKKELSPVANVMVIGDRKKFLSCLLTLKTKTNIDTGEPLDDLVRPARNWFSKHGFLIS